MSPEADPPTPLAQLRGQKLVLGQGDGTVGGYIPGCARLADDARAFIDDLLAPISNGGREHDFAGDVCFDPGFGARISESRMTEPETTLRLVDPSAQETATIANWMRPRGFVRTPADTLLRPGQTVSATWNTETDDIEDRPGSSVLWRNGDFERDLLPARNGRTLTFQIPQDVSGAWNLSIWLPVRLHVIRCDGPLRCEGDLLSGKDIAVQIQP